MTQLLPPRVLKGDCIIELKRIPDASVDAVVTDPPYGLEFMGKGWDGADGFRRSLNAADVDVLLSRVTGRRRDRWAAQYKAERVGVI